MRIDITLTTEQHDCSMCGPTGKTVARLQIDDIVDETWSQSWCDNSDPLDATAMLFAAMEQLGHDVHVHEVDNW